MNESVRFAVTACVDVEAATKDMEVWLLLGKYFGYGEPPWSPAQEQDIAECIREGRRKFRNPPPLSFFDALPR